MVHHMLVYECSEDFPKHHLNYTGRCYASNMPPPIEKCTGVTTIAAWAIGGKVSTGNRNGVLRALASHQCDPRVKLKENSLVGEGGGGQ